MSKTRTETQKPALTRGKSWQYNGLTLLKSEAPGKYEVMLFDANPDKLLALAACIMDAEQDFIGATVAAPTVRHIERILNALNPPPLPLKSRNAAVGYPEEDMPDDPLPF